jgi:hypothetical protein
LLISIPLFFHILLLNSCKPHPSTPGHPTTAVAKQKVDMIRQSLDSAGAKKTDSTGAIKADSAGADKADSAGVNKADSALPNKTDSAGVNKMDSAGVNKADSAGANKADTARGSKADPAGARKPADEVRTVAKPPRNRSYLCRPTISASTAPISTAAIVTTHPAQLPTPVHAAALPRKEGIPAPASSSAAPSATPSVGQSRLRDRDLPLPQMAAPRDGETKHMRPDSSYGSNQASAVIMDRERRTVIAASVTPMNKSIVNVNYDAEKAPGTGMHMFEMTPSQQASVFGSSGGGIRSLQTLSSRMALANLTNYTNIQASQRAPLSLKSTLQHSQSTYRNPLRHVSGANPDQGKFFFPLFSFFASKVDTFFDPRLCCSIGSLY